jgi:beta-1,4-mannosyl-glycoprotein beta-1,4-N-acetylglucosaminyltransferase
MINDELDLLEIRLNILYPFIEKFVIVESDRTHSGKPKEMSFIKNKERFEKFWSKIIYLQYIGHDVSNGYEAWGNENSQRDTILKSLDMEKPADGLFFVSDVDEIPKPEKLFEARCIACKTGSPVAINMHSCIYFMNFVSETQCRGPFLYNPDNAKNIQDKFGFDKYSPTAFRWQVCESGHENDYPNVNEAGWHFSTLGGIESIRKKLDSYAHTEFNTSEVKSEEHLLKCISEGIPYFEKMFKFDDKNNRFTKKDLSFLPDYVQFNIEKYRKYILN